MRGIGIRACSSVRKYASLLLIDITPYSVIVFVVTAFLFRGFGGSSISVGFGFTSTISGFSQAFASFGFGSVLPLSLR